MMAELKQKAKEKHDETPWWVRISVLLVGGVIGGLLLVVIWFTNEVKTYEGQNRENAIAACERGNDARVADIDNLRNDIHRLNAQLRSTVRDAVNIQLYLPEATEWVDSKLDEAKALKSGITLKQLTIENKLNDISGFAAHPGSSIVDCELAYPK